MSATDSTQSRRGGCTHKEFDKRGGISLPVLADHGPRGTIRKSKSGPRRAIVLATVQILLVTHILLWWFGAFGGRTTTPIEPSESMEFAKNGIVNVGLIFFAVALLSTLVLGRWFCGWGCHIVMLQDLCAWVMKKMGVRPKPFRSRLLIYVPLILALYMFVWPAAYRFGRWVAYENGWVTTKIQPWQVSTNYTTDAFWKTFPGAMVAVPFLLICGFATVYFLGAKGFCTYGCPYGGFFAPLDKFAVGKIRVTDDCEQCGHCTAVCTSNVRVHDEVREYGMVVDPGCMKCLDCVSVCPNDALYFGFGLPAVLAPPAKNAAPKRILDLSWGEEIALAFVFAIAFFAVRMDFSLLGFNGELLRLPLLFAAGTAGVTTFMVWKTWRMFRDPNVNLHRFRLRTASSVRLPGWIFLAATVAVVAFTAHVGAVNGMAAIAEWHAGQVTADAKLVFSGQPFELDAASKEHAGRGIAWFGRVDSLIPACSPYESWKRQIAVRQAWLYSCRREFDQAQTVLRAAIQRAEAHDSTGGPEHNKARVTPREPLYVELGQVIRAAGAFDAAVGYYEPTIAAHATYDELLADYIAWLMSVEVEHGRSAAPMAHDLAKRSLEINGRSELRCVNLARSLWLAGRGTEAIDFARLILGEEESYTFMLDELVSQCSGRGLLDPAAEICRARLARFPGNLHTMRWLSLLEFDLGNTDASLALLRQTIQIDPKNPNAFFFLAQALVMQNKQEEAVEAVRQGLSLSPEHPNLNQLMCELLNGLGRQAEAAKYCNKASALLNQPPPGIAAPQ